MHFSIASFWTPSIHVACETGVPRTWAYSTGHPCKYLPRSSFAAPEHVSWRLRTIANGGNINKAIAYCSKQSNQKRAYYHYPLCRRLFSGFIISNLYGHGPHCSGRYITRLSSKSKVSNTTSFTTIHDCCRSYYRVSVLSHTAEMKVHCHEYTTTLIHTTYSYNYVG
jgi:hypothetical protein